MAIGGIITLISGTDLSQVDLMMRNIRNNELMHKSMKRGIRMKEDHLRRCLWCGCNLTYIKWLFWWGSGEDSTPIPSGRVQMFKERCFWDLCPFQVEQ